MPRLDTARRVALTKNNGAKTIGQIHKEQSDWAMEYTWDNDIQSKVCYIYDYFHDDQPLKNKHMSYKNTTKTRIDAKFIVTQYGSINKDQVAFHIMFKPSQNVEFCIGDELYYFETDYRDKYNISFPISMYIDIPNDRGVYEKWLIHSAEYGNQFIKYNVLPCNYLFEWIETSGESRFKRRMWGVERQQLSYTSGVWKDYNFESLDNVEKAFLPLNEITKNIKYNNDENFSQRFVISAKIDNPLVWRVTKLENTRPLGILQLTFKQTSYDEHKDYVEKDDDGNIIGMWADYYGREVEPTDELVFDLEDSNTVIGKIKSSTSTIKVGGSYKTLTAQVFDSYGNDITDSYKDYTFNWSYDIGGEVIESFVTWRKMDVFNQIKLKLSNNKSYLNQVMNVKCEIKNKNIIYAQTQFEMIV